MATSRPLVLLVALIGSCFAGAIAAQGPPPRVRYASRCGSEIPWLDDFEAAKKAAAETGKPVFWFVPTSLGTRMDRKQELYWAMRGGPFFDADVVRFIRSRFVPLELGLAPLLDGEEEDLPDRDVRRSLARTYGLANLSFIEPGFLLLDSGMKPVAKMDGLSSLNATWLLERLRALVAEHEALRGPTEEEDGPEIPGRDEPEGGSLSSAARAAVREGRFAAAAALLEKLAGDELSPAQRAEAAWLHGAALHRTRRGAAGDAIWQRLVREHPDSRWAWKARLELDRMGPFVVGLETLRAPPASAQGREPLRGTQVGSAGLTDEEIARDALPVLLTLQREHGGWDDSRYDYGGLDSLPNVHVAVSALAAEALLAWRALAPEPVDAALALALPWILDDAHLVESDEDELIWAHVYRLELLARLLASERPDDEQLRRHARRIVEKVLALQSPQGSWRHEYQAGFTTASVVHALAAVAARGVKVPEAAIERAGRAIAGIRADDGTFAYGLRGKGAGVRSSAGRMPVAEHALLVAGLSDARRLDAAIATAFEHHGVLEAIRRYDDHADRHGNGGFFFWYDVHGLARAVAAAPMPDELRTERRARLREIVARTRELDGGWIDSHELGKTYGTAMALIVLAGL